MSTKTQNATKIVFSKNKREKFGSTQKRKRMEFEYVQKFTKRNREGQPVRGKGIFLIPTTLLVLLSSLGLLPTLLDVYII